MAQTSRRDLLQEIVVAAERHGRASHPEHEVGDLQDALRCAWELMTDDQREALHGSYFLDHEKWADEDTGARPEPPAAAGI